ncbi:MAG TPA: hypothetical protein DCY74_08420 [Clostridiales bacterium]|jgi:hypothetical protein|nr:hypothetical protein [Clostridiales bacterium]HCG35672.1 hypothetical protein [Clostridiales bacterium]
MFDKIKNLQIFTTGKELRDRVNEHWIQIEGRRKLVLENCKKVLYCDDNEVRLQSDFVVKITGTSLELKSLCNDYMAVVGYIRQIEFES